MNDQVPLCSSWSRKVLHNHRHRHFKNEGKVVHTLGSNVPIRSVMQVFMKVAGKIVPVTLHMIPHTTADVLLGVPSLREHSRAYQQLCREFKGEADQVALTTSSGSRHELEELLDKYPELIFNRDEITDTTRVYTEHIHLNLDNKRDNIYFTIPTKTTS